MSIELTALASLLGIKVVQKLERKEMVPGYTITSSHHCTSLGQGLRS